MSTHRLLLEASGFMSKLKLYQSMLATLIQHMKILTKERANMFLKLC